MCHSFSPAEFLLRKQLMITLWEFPCILLVAFPLMLFFFLSLIFANLITVSPDVLLLGLILPGTLFASCTWVLFPMLGNFSVIPSNTFLGPFSHSSSFATAKSLQSCLTLCHPIPGILQARTLEWVAISFSNA